MTMDYFLLLCSLLLPVVSAVEGKTYPTLAVFFGGGKGGKKEGGGACQKLSNQVSQHPLPLLSEAGAPQRVRLLCSLIPLFFPPSLSSRNKINV